jgi:hypothetical protein
MCFISDEIDGRENVEEVENVDSEHQNVNSECETRWEL